jgi:hypothetical protein
MKDYEEALSNLQFDYHQPLLRSSQDDIDRLPKHVIEKFGPDFYSYGNFDLSTMSCEGF